MIFKQISTGGDRNFAYLVGDEDSKGAALIDPSNSPSRVVEEARKQGLTVKYIINTHGHGDHTNGNSEAKRLTGATVVRHKTSAGPDDLGVSDGDEIKLGAVTLKIIHTPGHIDDAICILADGKLMTGDTLFVGKVGGTDYGQGARQEYDALHKKLMTLPGGTEVYPGHDYGTKPSSTIDWEKKNNPFILQESFDDFVHLKKNWVQYKKEHGIQ